MSSINGQLIYLYKESEFLNLVLFTISKHWSTILKLTKNLEDIILKKTLNYVLINSSKENLYIINNDLSIFSIIILKKYIKQR